MSPGRGPRRRGPPMGRRSDRRRAAAVRPHGRGLRGLQRVHGPPGRADRRLPRGDRAAREHADLLRRRQRRLRGGQPERPGQREHVLQRLAVVDRGQPRECSTGWDPRHLQPLPDRVGDGVLDAVPDVQALQLPGRRLRPAGDPLAEGVRGARGGPQPVPPRHRHRPDDLRVLRGRAAEDGARLRAVPAAGRVDEVTRSTPATRRRRRRRSTSRCSAPAGSGTRAGRR